MYQKLKVSLFFFLAIMILGCSVSTKVTMTIGNKRPPISQEEVKIYDSPEKVPGKYEEIALLTSKGDYMHTDFADIYNSMRIEASKIGANGLILGEFHDPTTKDKVLNAFFHTGCYRIGRGTAIFVFPTEEKETANEAK